MKAVLLGILGGAAAFVVLVALLIVTGMVFLSAESKPDPLVVQALRKAAASGVPIVEAIYDYRNRTGSFPQKLEDLARFSTIEVDPAMWTYEWAEWQWSLHYTGNEVQTEDPAPPSLYYHWDHMDRGTGWNVAGSRKYVSTQINAPVAIPDPPEQTPQQRYEAFVAEVRQRIDRDPRNPAHRQGLISRRIREGDLEAALSDAVRMHEQLLMPRWELQVLSYLLHQLHRDNWALRELAQVAQVEPSFIHYFEYAEGCKYAEQHEQAIQALERGCGSPFATTLSSQYVDEYYFCVAAAYAYRQKHYSLAIRICDWWQERCEAKGGGERSYYAIRGASNLALGKVDAAAPDIQAAIAANKEGATWADNLHVLEAMLKTKETTSAWDPGPAADTDLSDLLVAYH